MRTEQDARTDPQPGDVLRKGNCTRLVKNIGVLVGRPKGVQYLLAHAITHSTGWRHCETREGWRRWAKDAEVVKIGGNKC